MRETPEARAKRLAIWRHNGFAGSVRMAIANMRNILDSKTATDEAKQIASRIETDLTFLLHELGRRTDQRTPAQP